MTMTTTVYIIRHGQTVNAGEKRYQGHLDVPLAKEGERQLQQLARILKRSLHADLPGSPPAPDGLLDSVYCSDLTRAIKSADILAGAFGLAPLIVPAFRERGFGRWEGLTFAEIRQMYPAEFDAWVNDPLKFSPLGGESTLGVRDRVMPAYDDIVVQKEGKKIAIVAHGGVNRIILCEILGIPLQHIFRIEQDFGALNRLVYIDGHPSLTALNYKEKL